MRRLISMASSLCVWLVLGGVGSAFADVISFEDRPAGPCCFALAGPAQTLVYNQPSGVQATFTGGVILTGESNQTTDNTNVYATADPVTIAGASATLTNPLTITFSQQIQNFQIDILNALAGNYLMDDHNGHTMAFSLATTGGSIATEGFAAVGSQITISYVTNPSRWDFAIDNVLFDQPLTTGAPEPGSMALLGASLFGLASMRRRFKLHN